MNKYIASAAVVLIAVATASAAHAGAPVAPGITVTDSGSASLNSLAPVIGQGVTVTDVNNAPIVIGGGQGGGAIQGSNGANAFGNSLSYTDGTTGWNAFGNSPSSEWISIGGGGGNGVTTTDSSITFSVAAPKNTLSFVWGSSSVTNTVTLYDANNNIVGEVSANGGNTLNYGVTDTSTYSLTNANLTNDIVPGAIINITTATAFKTAVFSNSNGAGGFEIGGVSAVPLPAALPLFGSAIAGLVGFGLRKRKQA